LFNLVAGNLLVWPVGQSQTLGASEQIPALQAQGQTPHAMIGEMREEPVSLLSHWPVSVTSQNLRQLDHSLKHYRSS
jgi:hypothetical protein